LVLGTKITVNMQTEVLTRQSNWKGIQFHSYFLGNENQPFVTLTLLMEILQLHGTSALSELCYNNTHHFC